MHAENKSVDQTAHLRGLVCALVFRSVENRPIMAKLFTRKMSSADLTVDDILFFKTLFLGNTIRLSNGLYPDRDRSSVGPSPVQTVCKG